MLFPLWIWRPRKPARYRNTRKFHTGIFRPCPMDTTQTKPTSFSRRQGRRTRNSEFSLVYKKGLKSWNGANPTFALQNGMGWNSHQKITLAPRSIPTCCGWGALGATEQGFCCKHASATANSAKRSSRAAGIRA